MSWRRHSVACSCAATITTLLLLTILQAANAWQPHAPGLFSLRRDGASCRRSRYWYRPSIAMRTRRQQQEVASNDDTDGPPDHFHRHRESLLSRSDFIRSTVTIAGVTAIVASSAVATASTLSSSSLSPEQAEETTRAPGLGLEGPAGTAHNHGATAAHASTIDVTSSPIPPHKGDVPLSPTAALGSVLSSSSAGSGTGGGGPSVALVALPVALLSIVSGGLLAGSFHAVTGPDHLAALLPKCVGKRWFEAAEIGAIWGLGHGVSAVFIGMVAFFLKDTLLSGGGAAAGLVPHFSLATELLIGLSLIVIGAIGIKDASLFEQGKDASSSPLTMGSDKESSSSSMGALFFNGVLHGFSWDGTPTLAPALSFTSWGPVMVFLLFYGAGILVAMATATSMIGEGSVRVSAAFGGGGGQGGEAQIPGRLAFGSSVVAVLVGCFWTVTALT